jgi:hypothetical protein
VGVLKTEPDKEVAMPRFTKVVAAFGAGSVLLFSVGWQWANAQTPAQMEAERVRQLQNDNARRQQEETNRGARALIPKGSDDSPARPGAGGTARSAGGGDPSALCKTNPIRSGERNPLIGGRWRPADAPAGDSLTQTFQMIGSPLCAMFQLGIEFRERTFVNVIGEFPIQYGHKGDIWFACFPDTTFAFRIQNANQVTVLGDPPCRLRREDAAQAQSVSNRSATSAGVAATPGNAAATGGAALAFTAGAATPSGATVPVADHSFFVLRDSIESVMAQAGIQPIPGGSRVKAWSMACESNTPVCNQGAKALKAATVGIAQTDPGGRGRIPPVAPGTYYLFGTAESSAKPIIWDVKIDLKPGDNTVALDQRNAVPLK